MKELRLNILQGKTDFLDKVVEVMKDNNIIYSDNYGVCCEDLDKALGLLPEFMELLYRGSKHSKSNNCENGFTRIIEHNGVLLKMVYNSGPEIFVTVEKIPGVTGRVKIVTLKLLQERISEEEELKSKLRPVIDKYIKDGLTYSEITRIFIDVMKEFK